MWLHRMTGSVMEITHIRIIKVRNSSIGGTGGHFQALLLPFVFVTSFVVSTSSSAVSSIFSSSLFNSLCLSLLALLPVDIPSDTAVLAEVVLFNQIVASISSFECHFLNNKISNKTKTIQSKRRVKLKSNSFIFKPLLLFLDLILFHSLNFF